MNWYSIIWCDEISYNMTSYASSMRSIAWLKWRKCWTIRQVVWKWYDDTSCDMISYHSRGRGCRRGRGLCSRWRRETFFGNFTMKIDLRKITKMLKRSARKFCTFSLLNHYKMICFCSSYDKLCFQHKLWIFYISDIFNPECCMKGKYN